MITFLPCSRHLDQRHPELPDAASAAPATPRRRRPGWSRSPCRVRLIAGISWSNLPSRHGVRPPLMLAGSTSVPCVAADEREELVQLRVPPRGGPRADAGLGALAEVAVVVRADLDALATARLRSSTRARTSCARAAEADLRWPALVPGPGVLGRAGGRAAGRCRTGSRRTGAGPLRDRQHALPSARADARAVEGEQDELRRLLARLELVHPRRLGAGRSAAARIGPAGVAWPAGVHRPRDQSRGGRCPPCDVVRSPRCACPITIATTTANTVVHRGESANPTSPEPHYRLRRRRRRVPVVVRARGRRSPPGSTRSPSRRRPTRHRT